MILCRLFCLRFCPGLSRLTSRRNHVICLFIIVIVIIIITTTTTTIITIITIIIIATLMRHIDNIMFPLRMRF